MKEANAYEKDIRRLLPVMFYCMVLLQINVEKQYVNIDLLNEGYTKLLTFHILLLLLIWSFYKTYKVNPGNIPDNYEWKVDPNIGRIKEREKTGELRYCIHEKKYKPDRSHYCRAIEKNVLKMDHYCPWTLPTGSTLSTSDVSAEYANIKYEINNNSCTVYSCDYSCLLKHKDYITIINNVLDKNLSDEILENYKNEKWLMYTKNDEINVGYYFCRNIPNKIYKSYCISKLDSFFSLEFLERITKIFNNRQPNQITILNCHLKKAIEYVIESRRNSLFTYQEPCSKKKKKKFLHKNLADLCISIAVIHHLGTHEKRKQAVKEMVRCTKIGGRILIYVWAYEQQENVVGNRKFDSQDIFVPWYFQQQYKTEGYDDDAEGEGEEEPEKENEKEKEESHKFKPKDITMFLKKKNYTNYVIVSKK
ncbi:hypothetical protein C923_03055 [Plasmodium falciparum UGT5.1]|uniref:Palmitoyltransferase n=1 Tax=Plasmodium falciparum UGT5.1 TaxID=1237627 RepID=W7JBR7_PLAFA|nr:hypothetical protein C923_03055 [Plasmodium falciparum UGT5.1]